MATAEVAIVIRAKNEASKAFSDVIRDITKMKSSATDTFSVINRLGKTAFLGLAAGAGAAGLALFQFTKAAAQEEANIARLSTAIKTLSVDQQRSAAGVEALVKSREKLAFADDQIRDSLSLLIAQTGSYDEAVRRQAIAMDLARGTGLDLQLSSKLVGKVTEDNVEVLKRYGITIGEGATETQALAAIQGRFAGQSQAYAKTAAGQWERVTNEFQNMQETIGAALLPVVTKLGLALADFLAKHEGSFQRIGKGIADFANAVGKAAESITKTLKPALEFLDKGDRIAILTALAAVIAGPLVVAMIAFAAASVIAFATNPITLFIAAIAGIVVAITLIVRHWDQIWASMKDAPMALLNFVKRNFVDVMLAFFIPPAGIVAVILKHWNDIFDKMPAPVQHAMNLVSGFIEDMVNFAIAGINKIIAAVNKLIDALNKVKPGEDLGKIDFVVDVDFTRPTSDRFKGRGLGRFADGDFQRDVKAAGDALDYTAPQFDAYATGAFDTGDAAGSAAKQLTVLEAAMDGIITRAEAMTLGLSEQQAAELELAAAHEAVLDEEFRRRVELNALALAYPNLTGEEVKMRIGLEAIAEHLRRTGDSINKFIYDTSMQLLDGFRSAFDQIFNKPTKEDSQLGLQLLEAERRKLLSPNASESQRKAFDAEIDRLRNLIAIRRNADDILSARADLADNTALTDAAQATAAELYIAAIADASKQVQDNAGIVYLQTLATIGLKDQTLALTTTFANLNDAASNAAPLSLGQALEALAGLPDHGASLLPASAATSGTTVNVVANVNVQGDATERTVAMIKTAVDEAAALAVRRAGFGGSYVTSGAYTPA